MKTLQPNHSLKTLVSIPVDDARLIGQLTVPPLAQGIVVFAHGSGSSRHSPRNQYVAEFLQDMGLATSLEHSEAKHWNEGLGTGKPFATPERAIVQCVRWH